METHPAKVWYETDRHNPHLLIATEGIAGSILAYLVRNGDVDPAAEHPDHIKVVWEGDDRTYYREFENREDAQEFLEYHRDRIARGERIRAAWPPFKDPMPSREEALAGYRELNRLHYEMADLLYLLNPADQPWPEELLQVCNQAWQAFFQVWNQWNHLGINQPYWNDNRPLDQRQITRMTRRNHEVIDQIELATDDIKSYLSNRTVNILLGTRAS